MKKNNSQLERLKKLEDLNIGDTEQDVREDFINPLLQELGYQSGTQYHVDRELSFKLKIGSKKPEIIKVDYILSIANERKWILEAKRTSDSVWDIKNINQAHSYATHKEINVKFYALCNGNEFALYSSEDKHFVPIFHFRRCELTKYWSEFNNKLPQKSFERSNIILPPSLTSLAHKDLSHQERWQRIKQLLDLFEVKFKNKYNSRNEAAKGVAAYLGYTPSYIFIYRRVYETNTNEKILNFLEEHKIESIDTAELLRTTHNQLTKECVDILITLDEFIDETLLTANGMGKQCITKKIIICTYEKLKFNNIKDKIFEYEIKTTQLTEKIDDQDETIIIPNNGSKTLKYESENTPSTEIEEFEKEVQTDSDSSVLLFSASTLSKHKLRKQKPINFIDKKTFRLGEKHLQNLEQGAILFNCDESEYIRILLSLSPKKFKTYFDPFLD